MRARQKSKENLENKNKNTIWSMLMKLKYPTKVWKESGQASEKPKDRLVITFVKTVRISVGC